MSVFPGCWKVNDASETQDDPRACAGYIVTSGVEDITFWLENWQIIYVNTETIIRLTEHRRHHSLAIPFNIILSSDYN